MAARKQNTFHYFINSQQSQKYCAVMKQHSNSDANIINDWQCLNSKKN